MTRLVAILALLLCAACARSTTWEPFDRTTLPARERVGDARRVVLAASKVVRYLPHPRTGRPASLTTVRERVLLRRDEDGAGWPRVYYASSFAEVREIAARVIDPEGNERTFGPEDAVDAMAWPNWILVDDTRVRSLDVGRLRAGSVVEVVHTTFTEEPTLTFQGYTMGGMDPVLHERFEVHTPRGWELAVLTRRGGTEVKLPPAVREEAGTVVRTWEMRDVEPLADEPWSVPPDEILTQIHVQLASWTEEGRAVSGLQTAKALSAWTHDWIDHRSEVTPELRKLAKTILTETPPEPGARARKLFEWVRDNIQYCAIEVGYGGWMPTAADKVRDVRYGDCKGKANLLRSLLAVEGIPSRLVLISSNGGFARRFTLPALGGNFNHMVLEVELPGGKVLCDPTVRVAAFDEIPPSDRGSDYLPIQAGGAELLRTPELGADENRSSVVARMSLDGSGSFELTASERMAALLRLRAIGTPDERQQREAVEGQLGIGGTVRTAAFENLEPTVGGTPLVVRGTLRREGSARKGDGLFLRPSDLLARGAPVLPRRERKNPFGFVPYENRHEIRLQLPAGARIEGTLPAPVEVEGAFGGYRLAWTRQGDELVLERLVRFDASRLPASAAPGLLADFDRIFDAEGAAILVHLGESP